MKATRIKIEFEDGSALEANGKQAADIMDWYSAGESMLCVHGGEYKGEKFTKIPAPLSEIAGGKA